MLSALASIYDPLGLLNPLIIQSKIILQQATQMKTAWDEEGAPALQSKWTNWMSSLQKISDLQIPQCVKPAQLNDASMELHHFSDSKSASLWMLQLPQEYKQGQSCSCCLAA